MIITHLNSETSREELLDIDVPVELVNVIKRAIEESGMYFLPVEHALPDDSKTGILLGAIEEVDDNHDATDIGMWDIVITKTKVK